MKIIADDYGINKKENSDIIRAYKLGLVDSICIVPNCDAFDDAINKLKGINGIIVNIHLNISEGKAISQKKTYFLTDKNNNFKMSFIKALILSYNKKFLDEVYTEYKEQIEKIIKQGINPYSINSHIHIHAIPNIFNVVCRLAKKYNIKIVRTNYEKFYIIKDVKATFSVKFIINIIKNLILKIFTIFNMKTLKKFGLKTNKYLVGILYTSMMSKEAIKKGLNVCRGEDNVEVILHFVPKNFEYKML